MVASRPMVGRDRAAGIARQKEGRGHGTSRGRRTRSACAAWKVGHGAGMTGAAVAPEAAPSGRWPRPVAPVASTGAGHELCGACGGEVVTAAPRLAPSRSARVARAARRALLCGAAGDGGAATAEYAIATMAAVAFAGLLVVILQSDEVRGMLLDLVRRALTYDR